MTAEDLGRAEECIKSLRDQEKRIMDLGFMISQIERFPVNLEYEGDKIAIDKKLSRKLLPILNEYLQDLKTDFQKKRIVIK